MVLPNRFFMLNFKTLIKNEYDNAYDFAYDLPLKKDYSEPKIYTAKGDLTKRWYVYFSFRDPVTNKLKRQTPFYGNANTFRTKEDRIAVLRIYKRVISKYLRMGFSPYEDNTKRFLINRDSPKVTPKASFSELSLNNLEISSSKSIDTSEERDNLVTLREGFEFVYSIKEKILRDSSLRSYKNHIKLFQKWLSENYPDIKLISGVNRKVVNQFLNAILKKHSARYRNNFRSSLSSAFQVLEDNEIIDTNFVSKIKKLKSEPKKNKAYSIDMCDDIFEFLKEKDEYLLLYLKFVSYNFLRPLEVCRLKIGDINTKDKTLSFKAKNSPLKIKIIPEILFTELPNLLEYDTDSFLFTSEGFGKHSDTKLENRRGYFTKRFNKVVKQKFDLDLDHTLYSFRHTFITKLYRELVKNTSPLEAKSRLMHITGHSSVNVLDNYLRDIDADLPEDYSELLKK